MDHRNYFLKEFSMYSIRVITTSLLLLFLCLKSAKSDNVISSGATMRINPGTFVTALQDVLVENGGTFTIDGSLVLKNNFTNQNPVDDLGKGTIEFSGTSVQSIVGQNTLENLVVNNPAGLDLLGNTMLNNKLSLLNGLIRLGSNNLILGKLSTVIGTPSAVAMVVATGTGELRKSFPGIGFFTFPVGDESITSEYTPVTMNFTDGNFDPDNYVGVSVKTTALPEYLGNSLNRTWLLTQSGISGYQYDATFQYVPGDNNGNEKELLCVKVEHKSLVSYNFANTGLHQMTANGLNSFGIFSAINSLNQTGLQSNEESDEFKCFPNPFTKDITIEVQNNTKTKITEEICNLSGQHIRTLFKGIASGNLLLKWNGLNESGQQVASGVYLCKVNGQSKQVIYQRCK